MQFFIGIYEYSVVDYIYDVTLHDFELFKILHHI